MNTQVIEKPELVQVSLGRLRRDNGTIPASDTERVQRIVQRACAPVEKVANADLRMGYEVRNSLTGQRISEVSKEYTLVDNKRLIMPFMEHFGAGSLREIRTYGGGKFLYVTFDTGRAFDMGQGDIIRERIAITNSYDKTRAFSFALSAWRKICANGLHGWSSLGVDFHKIHVGDIPVENMIDAVLSRYHENAFQLWRDFANTPMTLEEQVALSQNFKAYEEEVAQGSVRGVLTNADINKDIRNRTNHFLSQAESVDNVRNAWGLFNQMNRAIGRTVDGNSQINKRILGNKNAERYIESRIKGVTSGDAGAQQGEGV